MGEFKKKKTNRFLKDLVKQLNHVFNKKLFLDQDYVVSNDFLNLQNNVDNYLDSVAILDRELPSIDKFATTNKVFHLSDYILKIFKNPNLPEFSFEMSQEGARDSSYKAENILIYGKRDGYGYTIAHKVNGPSFGQVYFDLYIQKKKDPYLETLLRKIQIQHTVAIAHSAEKILQLGDKVMSQKARENTSKEIAQLFHDFNDLYSVSINSDFRSQLHHLFLNILSHAEPMHYADRNATNERLELGIGYDNFQLSLFNKFSLDDIVNNSVALDYDKNAKVTYDVVNLAHALDNPYVHLKKKELFDGIVTFFQAKSGLEINYSELSTAEDLFKFMSLPEYSEYFELFSVARTYRNLRSGINRTVRNMKRILSADELVTSDQTKDDLQNVYHLISYYFEAAKESIEQLHEKKVHQIKREHDFLVDIPSYFYSVDIIKENNLTLDDMDYFSILDFIEETSLDARNKSLYGELILYHYLFQKISLLDPEYVNRVSLLGRYKTTFENEFGAFENQISKTDSFTPKPHFNMNLMNLGNAGYIYIGDKLTDVKFIENNPNIFGIILSKFHGDVKKYLVENDLEDQIIISTSYGLKDILDNSCQNLLEKNTHVTIGFDIDDTLSPKFIIPQDKAIKSYFKELVNDFVISPQVYDLITQYKKFAGHINGMENKLVYLLKSIFTLSPSYYSQIDSEVVSYNYDIYHDSPESLVNSVNMQLQRDLFGYNGDIYSNDLRQLEAEFSVESIEKQDVYFYKEIYDAKKFLEQKYKNKIDFRIITNKPSIVLEKIYYLAIEIK